MNSPERVNICSTKSFPPRKATYKMIIAKEQK